MTRQLTRHLPTAPRLCLAATALACLLAAHPAAATDPPPAPPAVAERVGVDQRLDAQVPLDLEFKDERGNPVRLADFFGRKPVVLSLVYYRCPGLCTMTLNGMSRSFKPLQFSAGREFEVVTVSIDPRETPALAAEKKSHYVRQYGREGADAGWHFLTGDQQNIEKLAKAVGFRYVYDEKTDQFAHGAAIMVLTPGGRLSRYFYGLEYSSRDLRWGLVEASEGRIGSLADAVNLLCYQYDPTTGKYGVPIMRALRGGAVLTVLGIGGFIFFAVRRERRLRAVAVAGGRAPQSPDSTLTQPHG
jgi:protein SCO1